MSTPATDRLFEYAKDFCQDDSAKIALCDMTDHARNLERKHNLLLARIDKLERENAELRESLDAMTEYATNLAVAWAWKLQTHKNRADLERLDADIAAAKALLAPKETKP